MLRTTPSCSSVNRHHIVVEDIVSLNGPRSYAVRVKLLVGSLKTNWSKVLDSDSRYLYRQKTAGSSLPLFYTWVTRAPSWEKAYGMDLLAKAWWLGLYPKCLVGLSPNKLHGFAFLWALISRRGKMLYGSWRRGSWCSYPGLPKLAFSQPFWRRLSMYVRLRGTT